MVNYILQSTVCLLVFLCTYEAFLKRETFFNYNRIYLLGSSVLAFVIPLIKIESLSAFIPETYIFTSPEVRIGNFANANTEVDALIGNQVSEVGRIQWSVELIVGIGAFVAFLLLLFKLVTIFKIIVFNNKERLDSFWIVTISGSTSAYSFFNYICIGDQIAPNDKPTIIDHEMVHVRQKHSLDLLWFELLRVVFWFNPLVYIYQSRLATLHEFIADENAIKVHGKTNYYSNLLQHIFNTPNVSFVNTFFNQSLIKKRLIMLNKNRSNRLNKLKYFLILPVVGFMLLITSCIQEDSNLNDTEEIESIQEKEKISVASNQIPFGVINQVPIYPGCESVSDEEQKQCFSKNVSSFVSENFNVDLAKELNLVGKQRIIAAFKISKSGEIIDVKARAPHPDLEAEAIRIVKLLPKMTPGEHEGKKVDVPYSLPILFVINDKDN